MEYAIFPMRTISISQRYSTTHKAWDINGDNTSASTPSTWYAPCTLKVLAINTTPTYNTVFFGTSDDSGRQTAVMCEDGVERVLTFACTHIDDTNLNNLFDTTETSTTKFKTGSIIPSGTPCYMEGTKGVDINNSHIHMEVGLGWQSDKKKPDYNLLNTTLPNGSPLIANVFRKLTGFNSVGNSGANGYTFAEVNSREVEEETPSTGLTGLYLEAVLGEYRIRKDSPTGVELTRVPKGAKSRILEFMPGFYSASDGNSYQWAKVTYNGFTGWSQLDLHQDYKIVCDTNFSKIYLRAVDSYFNVRPAKNTTGTPLGRILPGNRIELLAISTNHESGGYQWAKVNFNGSTGYVQIDTVGFNQLES